MTDHDLPHPNGICIACQQTARVMKHDPTGRVALYCPHNQAGAFLQPTNEGPPMWTIFTPMSNDELVDSMLKFAERFRAAFGSAGAPLQ
jgi:hypothetical protein